MRKARGIKRPVLPSYTVVDLDAGRRTLRLLGDDPDGGIRTLGIEDMVAVPGNGRRWWEIEAIDYKLRTVYVRPYRHHAGLKGLACGCTLKIAERAYESPGYATRRRHADLMAMSAMGVILWPRSIEPEA